MPRTDRQVLLETSVIIHRVFDETRSRARIERMFTDLNGNAIRWKVPSTVEKESREKIGQLHGFLQFNIKGLYDTVKSEHAKNGKSVTEFDSGDIDLIRQFFLDAMQRGSQPQKERLEYLETFIITGIQDAQKRGNNVKKSFAWLAAEIRTMKGNLLLRLDTLLLEVVGKGSSQGDVDNLKPSLGMMKEPDLFILAEVILYNKSTGLKCLLASVDYTDFVRNSQIIEATTGVVCCDPLYLITRYNTA